MTIMVIVVVERIKRSRREEADGGQLKRVVDKSRQLEEGKPYCTAHSRQIEKSLRLMLPGHVVAVNAESGPGLSQPTRDPT